MDYAALIGALLQAFGTFGPGLVKSIVNLMHGNPQQQGETDEAYTTRIQALVVSTGADTTAVDNSIING
jgi:hypothetical protein